MTTPDYTCVWYSNVNSNTRGLIDRNFVLDDGSAFTLNALRVADPRLVQVPFAPCMGSAWGVYCYLPLAE